MPLAGCGEHGAFIFLGVSLAGEILRRGVRVPIRKPSREIGRCLPVWLRGVVDLSRDSAYIGLAQARRGIGGKPA